MAMQQEVWSINITPLVDHFHVLLFWCRVCVVIWVFDEDDNNCTIFIHFCYTISNGKTLNRETFRINALGLYKVCRLKRPQHVSQFKYLSRHTVKLFSNTRSTFHPYVYHFSNCATTLHYLTGIHEFSENLHDVWRAWV